VQSLIVQNSLFDFVSFLIRKGLRTFHRYYLTPVRFIAGRALTILPLMSWQAYSGPNMRCRPISDIEDGFAFATFQSPFHFNEHQRDKCHSFSTSNNLCAFPALTGSPVFHESKHDHARRKSVREPGQFRRSLPHDQLPRRPKLFGAVGSHVNIRAVSAL